MIRHHHASPSEPFMRTTLDIDDDLLAAAKELSRQQGVSAGQVVSALLRQALAGGGEVRAPAGNPAMSNFGFRPFASRGAPVTNAAIDALRDAEGV
jgi:hypothetical protein